MGDCPSDLKVLHVGTTVSLGDNFMACIMDHQPMMNVQPFGQCQSILNPMVAAATAANFGVLRPMPCIPNTPSPWMNGKMDVLVKGHPALLDCSKLMCVWAGMVEITDDGQGSNQMTTGASKGEIDSIPGIPECIALFRPHSGYQGEYGFDWIRKEAQKIRTVNGTRGNDRDTEKLLGKYSSIDCRNLCPLPRRSRCQDASRNTKNVCLNINGWSTNFERDKNPPNNGIMFRALRSYFKSISVPGFVSEDYDVPVLTILPTGEHKKIKLLLMFCIKDETFNEGFLRFEYNTDIFRLDLDPSTLIMPDVISDPNDYTQWQCVEFELECLKEFSEDEHIKVYCHCPEKAVHNYRCGELRILANDASHRETKKVVLVEVTADIGNDPDPKTGEFSSDDFPALENILRQSYVSIPKDPKTKKYPQAPLDLAPWITDFKKNHVDSSRTPKAVRSRGLLEFLNKKLIELDSKYSDYYKVYSINEWGFNDRGVRLGGVANPDIKACAIFEGGSAETIPHELLHLFGLPHTFTHRDLDTVIRQNTIAGNARFTYEARKTDNIMDYSHLDGITPKSTFYWQWQVINKKISKP